MIALTPAPATDARRLERPKTHGGERRVQQPGARFYSSQLGRWVSRDPIGERGGINVLLAAENSHVMNVDYRGLSLYQGMKMCKAAKKLWDSGKEIKPESSWWNFYILFRRVNKVKFKCKKDCCYKFDDPVTGFVDPLFSGRRKCTINICADNFGIYGWSRQRLIRTIVHEMTHCHQGFQRQPHKYCGQAVCNEVQAYWRANPDPRVTDDELLKSAWRSAGTLKTCKGSSLESLWRDIDKDKFVKHCKEHGFTPSLLD
jgi:RHS repeat-associated protein